jgi:hypothetical protein
VRKVEAAFDGGRVTSDGGLLLLRELAQRLDLFPRFASCFRDARDPGRVEYTVEELVAQRVYALCCGYEDVSDHDTLRDDAMLACAVGRQDLVGAKRRRAQDRGHALAGESTLNRVELGAAEIGEAEAYKRIAHDSSAIESLFVELFLESQETPPTSIVLDFDATDDPLHGKQEGRFFPGYYKSYCYLPLYVFCGDHLLVAKLRPSSGDGAAGSLEELQRLVAQIRGRWPSVEIIVRADSGFCRDWLMAWCEDNDVHYVLGLSRNARLSEAIAGELAVATARHAQTGQPEREFKEFRYRTLESWTRERRVVGKAERLDGKDNPRFVVSTLPAERWDARALYEDLYAARGEMENRIKEQQLQLFADRLSTHTMRGNQFRLWLSSLAYTLVETLRRLGLRGTELANAESGTIRVRLLKIGAVVRVSVRRVNVSMSSVFPLQDLFRAVIANLRSRQTMVHVM